MNHYDLTKLLGALLYIGSLVVRASGGLQEQGFLTYVYKTLKEWYQLNEFRNNSCNQGMDYEVRDGIKD